MMREERMTFELEGFDAFKSRALGAVRALDRGEAFVGEAHLSFPDLETLLTIITPKRFALLRTLRQSGANSVRALAGALARDYKAVHGDVAALVTHGLIKREAKDRVSVRWDHVHADLRLAA
jgi:predicted transcriptional regulator